MSLQKMTPREKQFLREALTSDSRACNIRLREGEYQYNLAKTIASFQLELVFPNVKDIIERLFGKERVEDIQFVRKIQTILKKMEKSNIVAILPKKKPWDLQRYGLLSFSFIDADRNLVYFASDDQIKEAQEILESAPSQTMRRRFGPRLILFLTLMLASYTVIVWSFIQPVINPAVFLAAYLIAVLCSLMIGKTFSRG